MATARFNTARLQSRAHGRVLRPAARLQQAARPVRSALRVTAFREVHRVEQLVEIAREWASEYAQVLSGKPGSAACFSQLCDAQIQWKNAHPMSKLEHSVTKGLDVLLTKLEEERKAYVALGVDEGMGYDPVLLVAANDAADVVFVLIRLRLTPKGSSETSYTHIILKLDCFVDDTVRRVYSVIERAQSAGGMNAEIRMEEAAALKHAQHVRHTCAMPFPDAMIKPWAESVRSCTPDHGRGVRTLSDGHPGVVSADMVEQVEERLAAWCSARCSGTDTGDLMGQALGTDVDGRFKLYDAYGVLPLLSEHNPHKADGAPAPGKTDAECVMDMKEMKEVFQATKEVYNVSTRVVDEAVCLDKAVAFTHWRSNMLNHITQTTSVVEGFEVDILDPSTGEIQAVYLMRDPLDCEASIIQATAKDSEPQTGSKQV